MVVGGPTGREAKCNGCDAMIEVVVEFGGGVMAMKVRHPEPVCAEFRKHRDLEDLDYAFRIVQRAQILPRRQRS